MKFKVLSLMILAINTFSFENIQSGKLSFYQKVFPTGTLKKEIKIPDPISKKPINVILTKVYDSKKKHLGFFRSINTSTGCDSACLPVIFTLFYDTNKTLIKMLSKPGLTKKFHAKFTEADYQKMELILTLNPEIFKTVKHPTEMVDALSGATKKQFRDHVVKNGAYTSLRVNLYNQQTLGFLRTLK